MEKNRAPEKSIYKRLVKRGSSSCKSSLLLQKPFVLFLRLYTSYFLTGFSATRVLLLKREKIVDCDP